MEAVLAASDTLRRVRAAALDALGALPAGARPPTIILGCSGGADSAALLAAVSSGGAGEHLRAIAVHVDHGVHPARALAVAAVSEQCRRLGVPLRVCTLSPPLFSTTRRSSEASLREGRYAALRSEAALSGATAIFVAHHLDDQIETLLMRGLRGAGPRGLAAMRGDRELGPGLRLVRPFLRLRPSVLRAAAIDAGLGDTLVRDPTNSDQGYLRNRVRHTLLPELLRRHGPALAELLADVVLQLGRLREQREALLLPAVREARREGVGFELSAALLRQHPAALRAELVLECLHRLHPGREPRRLHVEGLLDLARRSRGGSSKAWTLPGGCAAQAVAGGLLLLAGQPAGAANVLAPAGAVVIDELGRHLVPGWGALQVDALPAAPSAAALRDSDTVCFPAAAVQLPLVVRAVSADERMRCFGEARPRRLLKLLAGRGVPPDRRRRWPVVACRGLPLWLVGVRRCALAPCVPGEPGAVLRLRWTAGARPSGGPRQL